MDTVCYDRNNNMSGRRGIFSLSSCQQSKLRTAHLMQMQLATCCNCKVPDILNHHRSNWTPFFSSVVCITVVDSALLNYHHRIIVKQWFQKFLRSEGGEMTAKQTTVAMHHLQWTILNPSELMTRHLYAQIFHTYHYLAYQTHDRT